MASSPTSHFHAHLTAAEKHEKMKFLKKKTNAYGYASPTGKHTLTRLVC